MGMINEDYIFDIENMVNFVFDGAKERSTETTESYVLDDETNTLVLANKVVREVNNGDNSTCNTIKYDLLKMFMDALFSINLSESSSLSFGETVTINTLVNNGIIRRMDNER